MRLYIKFLSMHLKSQMQYKISFFLTLAGQCLVSIAALLGVYFMFSRFSMVEGFSLPQVLLCFATVLMAFSLAQCFGSGFNYFPQMIGNAEFDRVLVRPRQEIFQVLASKTEFTRFGQLFPAIFVFCYAIPASGVIWSWDKIVTLFIMVSCGSIIFFCLFLIYAAISFFTIEGLEFMNVFTEGGKEFGRYPFSIYGKEVLRFLTFIIPLALFQYYPLLYLLDLNTSLLYMLTPLLGLLFIIPSSFFWKLGLRRYKSTGS